MAETMNSSIGRRQFLAAMGVSAAVLPLVPRLWSARQQAAAAPRQFRGVFAIMQTPFDMNDQIDEEDLARETNFCVRAGSHGLVWPQLGGEFYLLSEEERMHGAEIITRTAAHRTPVVIGVQATTWEVATRLARHAEEHGADAVIAIPPFLGHVSLETALNYYHELARAVKLPIFIQNSEGWGPVFPTNEIIRMARENPQLAYIKEEAPPVPHRISEYAKSGVMRGIFSGNAGKNMINELPRGSNGTMPACEFIDVDVQIYNLYTSGKTQEAQELFDKLLPMIGMEETYGMVFAKSVLVRRGVFKTAKMRGVSGGGLDSFDQRELDTWWKSLAPYLKV